MAGKMRLSKSEDVTLADGRVATVVDKLGEGGQGVVYRVRLRDSGEERALKWSFVHKMVDPEAFYRNLQQNVKAGSPSFGFVWPQELTERRAEAFGYVMDVFPPQYKPFPRFLMARERFASVSAMVDAALNIVVALMALHNKGNNYQDLNDGNLVIDPQTGDVLLCDNDNVVGQGFSSGVLGKARFMAPEVVRGDAMPDKHTDRYSLALILFMLLVGDHPLEGARTNVPALTNKYDRRFFGEQPLFIFDPKDDSNRPIAGLHRNAVTLWPVYPDHVQQAFQKAFSQESLLRAEGRVHEQEWLYTLLQLKSSVANCPHCGRELLVGLGRTTKCPACRREVKPLGFLRFQRSRFKQRLSVPIVQGVRLFDYHMNDAARDYKTIAATVVLRPGKVGLQNCSRYRWTVTSSDGKTATREPGSVAVLHSDFQIDFANGEIADVVGNK